MANNNSRPEKGEEKGNHRDLQEGGWERGFKISFQPLREAAQLQRLAFLSFCACAHLLLERHPTQSPRSRRQWSHPGDWWTRFPEWRATWIHLRTHPPPGACCGPHVCVLPVMALVWYCFDVCKSKTTLNKVAVFFWSLFAACLFLQGHSESDSKNNFGKLIKDFPKNTGREELPQ